jgi:very-short-patch-repair endonuclease
MREPSSLERAFLTRWKQLAPPNLPLPLSEYRFDRVRRWKFDFCFTEHKLAVELEGIGSGKSRHTSFVGYAKDCEKYNTATLAGWRILRFTGQMLEDDPQGCIDTVVWALTGKKPEE